MSALGALGAVHLVDINGDAQLDIVHGSGVRRNLGGGTFGAPVVVTTGPLLAEAHPGDFDGDGDTDIAFLSEHVGTLEIQVMQQFVPQTFIPRPKVTLGGVTIVLQVYDYDGAYGGLDAYFISNPTMPTLRHRFLKRDVDGPAGFDRDRARADDG